MAKASESVIGYRSPARVDLAGGTLDVPPLCWLIPGAMTVNVAVDLYAEAALSAGDYGSGKPLDEGRDLVRIALEQAGLDSDIRVALRSEVPESSGLGGSSALLVSLVQSCHVWGTGVPLDAGTLLDRVTVCEHRLLGKPAGRQDAVASIHGGLSIIRFHDGRLERESLALPTCLRKPLILAYAPREAHSGINNWEIVRRVCEGDRRLISSLRSLADNAHAVESALTAVDTSELYRTLRIEAEIRESLAPGVVCGAHRSLLKALGPSAWGKICGAGGGGCMWLVGVDDTPELERAASSAGVKLLRTHVSPGGCVPVERD